MKRTATITWISYKNFGTYLQAYALQYIVTRLGFSNAIISDQRLVDQIERERSNQGFFLIKWLRILKHTLFPPVKKPLPTDTFYDHFAQKYLKIDYSWKNYAELNQNYDVFLCGSDQIWSPIVPFRDFYYLAFTDKTKIAYAPSIGSSSYPQECVDRVKPLLAKFDALSVREQQGEAIIKQQFGLNCTTVLDPTLLLEKQDWMHFIHSEHEEPYVLCYLLTYNEQYWNFVRDFARERHLKLKGFIINPQDRQFVDVPLYAGPEEFLNAIYHADYFFTDSFHGSVFALQFEKNFYTFKRFRDDAKNNQNSRILNLFGKLGLQNRFIGEKDLAIIEHNQLIDYLSLKEKLKIERESSLTYLKRALNFLHD